jgi:hypothetical protein
MPIYRHKNLRAIAEITPTDRLRNQVTFVGSDEVLSLPNGIFFLELLVLEGAKTVAIKDGNGDTIATGLTGFEQDHSPLRCDRGIEFVGDIEFAKGFILEDAFVS